MNQAKPYPGLFLTIEGGEGSGKSTLAKGLVKRLQEEGKEVVATREPGGTFLAEHIRQILLHEQEAPTPRAELLLFLAARLEHIEKVIMPHLNQGKVVVCERFHDSSIAYQGYGRNLGAKWVLELCMLACRGFKPDLTFLLDLDPKISFSRLSHKTLDRLEREGETFHQLVRQGYLHLADENPERIVVLDASLNSEQLLQLSLDQLYPLFKAKKNEVR